MIKSEDFYLENGGIYIRLIIIPPSIIADTPFNDNLQFNIDRTSGNLTVNGSVDRETFSRYFVTISVCLVLTVNLSFELAYSLCIVYVGI